MLISISNVAILAGLVIYFSREDRLCFRIKIFDRELDLEVGAHSKAVQMLGLYRFSAKISGGTNLWPESKASKPDD